MPDYIPENFDNSYNTPLGRRMWAFLNEQRTIDAMLVATSLGKPALGGIEQMLLESFGGDIEELIADRFKQMIGHMVRQVMAFHGFEIEQQDVKVTSAIFSRATRYKRRDHFVFHAWRGKNRTVALTETPARDRLPAGNWKYWKGFDAGLAAAVVLELPDQKSTIAEIRKNGSVIHEIPRFFRGAA